MHANSSRIGVAPRFVARQGGLTRGVTAGEVDDTGSAGAVGDAGGQCTKGLGQLAGTAPATDIHALIKTTMSQCCSPVNSTVMPFGWPDLRCVALATRSTCCALMRL